MEHDHMIEALATNGSNHSLYIGSLPRRARRRQDFADAHALHLFSEVIAEDSIAVAQQVVRELVKGKSLPQLLSRPLRGRAGSHVEVQNATPVMGQDQKHVKNLETDSGHREEVDGDQLLGVILQKVRRVCGGPVSRSGANIARSKAWRWSTAPSAPTCLRTCVQCPYMSLTDSPSTSLSVSRYLLAGSLAPFFAAK
jgi:hypothetical protein